MGGGGEGEVGGGGGGGDGGGGKGERVGGGFTGVAGGRQIVRWGRHEVFSSPKRARPVSDAKLGRGSMLNLAWIKSAEEGVRKVRDVHDPRLVLLDGGQTKSKAEADAGHPETRLRLRGSNLMRIYGRCFFFLSSSRGVSLLVNFFRCVGLRDGCGEQRAACEKSMVVDVSLVQPQSKEREMVAN